MFKKVAFTMYPVTDIDRAKEFYSQTLGLGSYKEMGNGKWIEFDLPEGGCFAITSMIDGVSPSDTAGASIAFEVENIENLLCQLKEKGVQFKLDLFESPVCKIAVAFDTEGNTFMLHQLHRKT
ncbi:MAG: VOC family protein [Deltaproteobacteria bacterium]|nr:VOC family protein [Deltaproteobacteria bacterium]